MLHNCPPPINELARWLREIRSANGNYGHLLLEQLISPDNALLTSLRAYFESAHLDARDKFHEVARIDLHPDASAHGVHAQYPSCLPPSARNGLFGEVMAGLITESYSFIGDQTWKIPVFLFRYHAQVADYMFELVQDSKRTREVAGRHGNDFIGLALNNIGQVTGFIVGEAKWRKTLHLSTMNNMLLGDTTNQDGVRVLKKNGIWDEMNAALPIPKGLQQLREIIRERDDGTYAATILSLDVALLHGAAPLPRTNLLMVVGNRTSSRKNGVSFIPADKAPTGYEVRSVPLQVVEVVLNEGESLIETLYSSLWNSTNDSV